MTMVSKRITHYHLVATYSVIGPPGGIEFGSHSVGSGRNPRANPKSQILSSQSALTSRFPGLRSRCMTLAEWMYCCGGNG